MSRDAVPSLAAPADEVVRLAARAYERDRYLAALLSPRDRRDDLVALAAFAGEIGRIAAYVGEPMMGMIRLQWWRDTLAAVAVGDASGHPVADALGGVMRRHSLPQAPLAGFIDAHEAGLSTTPFADDAALLDHLERTQGALFALALRIVGSAADPAPLASAAGRAYGMARVLVEAPVLAGEHRTLLPADRLARAGLAIDGLRQVASPPALAEVVRPLAALARADLARLRTLSAAFDRATFAALLPCALVEPYLGAVERARGPDQSRLAQISPLTRVWRLWRAHRRRRL